MVKGACIKCNKEKDVAGDGKTRGWCHVCYKRLLWKPKIRICLRCKRGLPIHARGFCVGCYNSLFHIDKVRAHNRRKIHNIDNALYEKITKECVLCGFDKIVDLHHLDRDRSNNSELNFVGLCPNHHKMLHHRDFQHEVYGQLTKKGYNALKPLDADKLFKKQE
ncbi:MAG: hypothetical protein AABY02_02480 [Nanoarchaeota archaeon]